MRKGFTLIELLTVMMIMGLMGTAAIGGYRAMQRGMEERGVMQNANAAIRAVYQRAQIDRQPTAIFFWNETLQSDTADQNAVVVGKAVAVRRHGRISNVVGAKLVDEFGDLNLAYPTAEGENSSGNRNETMFLYPMDQLSSMSGSSELRRSKVSTVVTEYVDTPLYYSDMANKLDGGEISTYAFELVEPGGVVWKAGMAYGCEFLSIQLPHGYIFGSSYSSSTSDPVKGVSTMVFKPGRNSGNGLNSDGTVGGNDTIEVSALRPVAGSLQAKRIGTTNRPGREQ